MKVYSIAAVLGAWCMLGASAQASPHTLLTSHVPAGVQPGAWLGAVPRGTMLRLAITLPLHNEALLDTLLAQLQDDHSPLYRHFLSNAEFTRRFGPTAAEYATLHAFAQAHGLRVAAEAPNRFVMDVEGDAATVEQAFGIHLGRYRRADGSVFSAPDREPIMDIALPVLHVSGLDDFAPPKPRSRKGSGHALSWQLGSAPTGDYTGTDMRNAYYGGTALTGTGQSVALVEFIGYNIADVQNYFSTLYQTQTVPVVGISVDGTPLDCTGTCDDFEPSIDIEQTIAMAPGLTQVSFYIGANVIDILNRIATDNTAKTISSSYGWPAEQTVEDPVYKQFAAQGQTMVDGSGDLGSNLGQGGVWPADDPWVTGVGGTILTTQSAGGPWAAETAWPLSGGGPSPNAVKLPHWQKRFQKENNEGSLTLRNVPDVAAEADYDNYACYDGGCYGGNGGTSFSAPRWAGFIALANQQAMATKNTTIGFLNKTLYLIGSGKSYGSTMHDITSGANQVYQAVTSYDLVTGFGSPQPGLIGLLVGKLP